MDGLCKLLVLGLAVVFLLPSVLAGIGLIMAVLGSLWGFAVPLLLGALMLVAFLGFVNDLTN